jgi:hypothetical protein
MMRLVAINKDMELQHTIFGFSHDKKKDVLKVWYVGTIEKSDEEEEPQWEEFKIADYLLLRVVENEKELWANYQNRPSEIVALWEENEQLKAQLEKCKK